MRHEKDNYPLLRRYVYRIPLKSCALLPLCCASFSVFLYLNYNCESQNFGFKSPTAGINVVVLCTQKSTTDYDTFMRAECLPAEYLFSIPAQGEWVVIFPAETCKYSWFVIF